MANTRKKSTTTKKSSSTKGKSTTKKNTSSAKKTSSSKSNTNTTTKAVNKPSETVSRQGSYDYANNNEPSAISTGMEKFYNSRLFFPVVIFVLVLIIIGLDFLFTLNDYSKFFNVLGFELIIAGIIYFIILAITTFNSDSKKTHTEGK